MAFAFATLGRWCRTSVVDGKRGEGTAFAAHLRENDQRADLCFWDKAKGYLELKAELEREASAPLSLREFSRMLSEGGTSIGHVLLSTFKFAVDRLESLGPAAVALTGRDVAARIQPRIGAITRLAVKLGRDDAWVQERLMEPELELARTSWERKGTLDVDRIVEAIHQRLADELLVTRAGLETMLGVADKVPQASGVELRATAVPQKQSTLFSTQPSSSGTEPERFTQRGATAIGSSSRVSREAEHDRPTLPEAPGQGAAAPDTDAGHDEQHDIDQAQSVSGDGGVEHAHTPLYPATERSLDESPTHAGPRPGTTESVQERLWAALSRFVEHCGLTRSLRAAPPLPYGFMVEPPDLPACKELVMQDMKSLLPCPTSNELQTLHTLVADTVSTAVAIGSAREQFLGWEVQVWTSESRLTRRAHLRILYRNALWQQSDWILDWPRSNSTLH